MRAVIRPAFGAVGGLDLLRKSFGLFAKPLLVLLDTAGAVVAVVVGALLNFEVIPPPCGGVPNLVLGSCMDGVLKLFISDGFAGYFLPLEGEGLEGGGGGGELASLEVPLGLPN